MKFEKYNPLTQANLVNIKGGNGDENTGDIPVDDTDTPTPITAENKGSFAVSGKSST